MTNEITIEKTKEIFHFSGSMQENIKMAEMIAGSDMVPSDYRGKPENVIVAVQMGQEVGLKPTQALQGIAVINGRPCIWGDALIGLVRKSKHCEYVRESFDHETMTATCRAKRIGDPEEHVVSFSKSDAETAGLWDERKKVYSQRYKKDIDNTSPWHKFPKRMLQMRARGFCLRDLFADVLKGLTVLEEERDTQQLKQVNDAPAKSEKASRVNDFIQDAEVVESIDDPVIDAQLKQTAPGIKAMIQKMSECGTQQELAALAPELGKFPDEFKPELRTAYSKFNAKLQGEAA